MPFDTITIWLWLCGWIGFGKKGFVNFDTCMYRTVCSLSLSLPLFLSHLCRHTSDTARWDTSLHTYKFSNLLINLAIILSVTGSWFSHKIYIRLSKWYGPWQQQEHFEHNIQHNFSIWPDFFSFYVHAELHTSATHKREKRISEIRMKEKPSK